MKFLFLIACGIVISVNAFCQPDSTRTWQVRLAPLSIIDPRTPALQVGLQKRLSRRLAFSAEYGLASLGWLQPKNSKSPWHNFRYQKVRTEVKYFLGLKKEIDFKQLQPYVSVETFLLPQNYTKQNDYFWRDPVSYHYDFSKIQKTVWGNCLKIGLESNINRNWVMDFYWGLGVRSIFIKHHRLVNLRPEEEPYMLKEWFSGDDKDKIAGWQQTLHVALGFKLGYYIW
ncbi:hypothetical protein [Adhaeribacter pallidiroseus]|uniref:DUF3575 domain-containing protein n=1 Tax=Adhaeribacter pallidiroseus TaxID=2072847 RepID=A0A369QP53_9BACT|nr:hypothetical protein [Adhaeribacter pallidiroseus]RDC66504.1 hypothetical protein AHMF7616_05135 [Adhaeribacter pallidiroseus]